MVFDQCRKEEWWERDKEAADVEMSSNTNTNGNGNAENVVDVVVESATCYYYQYSGFAPVLLQMIVTRPLTTRCRRIE